MEHEAELLQAAAGPSDDEGDSDAKGQGKFAQSQMMGPQLICNPLLPLTELDDHDSSLSEESEEDQPVILQSYGNSRARKNDAVPSVSAGHHVVHRPIIPQQSPLVSGTLRGVKRQSSSAVKTHGMFAFSSLLAKIHIIDKLLIGMYQPQFLGHQWSSSRLSGELPLCILALKVFIVMMIPVPCWVMQPKNARKNASRFFFHPCTAVCGHHSDHLLRCSLACGCRCSTANTHTCALSNSHKTCCTYPYSSELLQVHCTRTEAARKAPKHWSFGRC